MWEWFLEGVSCELFNGFIFEDNGDRLPLTTVGLFELSNEELDEGVIMSLRSNLDGQALTSNYLFAYDHTSLNDTSRGKL
jgi:hypothetical protein